MLTEAFTFFDIFFKLPRAFGLLAFALLDALLRLGFKAGLAFGSSLVGGRGLGRGGGGWRSIRLAAENFKSFLVHFSCFLCHER